MNKISTVWQHQKPLYDRYKAQPELAKITDVAWIKSDDLADPFHTEVMLNDELRYKLPVGLHRAVGGLHDLPNPGDILSASLAACFESTLRMIANRFNIKITNSNIKVSAHVDVKGTLVIDRTTPVGFTSIDMVIKLTSIGTDKSILDKLMVGVEHCCVVYQTLKNSVKINTNYQFITV
jgi:uncharacterized OsmC-like protein